MSSTSPTSLAHRPCCTGTPCCSRPTRTRARTCSLWTPTRARSAGASAAPKKERKTDQTNTGSHNPVGTGSYATASGAFSAQRPTGSHRTTGAPASRPPAQRKSKRAAAPEPEDNGRKKLFAIAAVILIGIGGVWLFVQSQEATGPIKTAETGPTEPDPEAEASEAERIQKAIATKLERERQELIDRQREEDAKLADAQEEEEDRPLTEREGLVAVPPSEQTTKLVKSTDGGIRQPTKLPTRQRQPVRQPTRQASSTTGSAQATTRTNTALTYLTKGRKLLQEGNFGNAKKFLDKAIEKDPNCRSCYETRAEVKKALGDPAGAAADLAKAGSLEGAGSARAGQ